jgi:hypothetical protein
MSAMFSVQQVDFVASFPLGGVFTIRAAIQVIRTQINAHAIVMDFTHIWLAYFLPHLDVPDAVTVPLFVAWFVRKIGKHFLKKRQR